MTPQAIVTLLVAGTVAAGCGGSGAGGSPRDESSAVEATGPAERQTATVVSTDDLTYDPGVVRARVGTLVLTHRNGGAVPHNLVFDDRSLGAIDTVTGGQDKSITLTFSKPGSYDFVCTFHPGQDGEVVVS